MISLGVPSLKSIDQKMYKNHAVISQVEHLITFLTIVMDSGWNLMGHLLYVNFWRKKSFNLDLV